jgi:enediyne biosynthesis protein E4
MPYAGNRNLGSQIERISRRELLRDLLSVGVTEICVVHGLVSRMVGESGTPSPARASKSPSEFPAAYLPRYEDFASSAGLNSPTIIGDVHRKNYIIETMGGGIALFDYDGDGWLDIFVVNGSRLEGFPVGEEPTNHLYHNNRDGTFTDLTKAAGLIRSGWGQGVCVGDYDNDGHIDLFVSYYGKNVLYHNNGNGTFTDVTQQAGLEQIGNCWNTGCAFLDYDRDGHLDLFVANYVAYEDGARVPPKCSYKGVEVNCGPLGLRGSRNFLYHNDGRGKFVDVSEKAGFLSPETHYCFTPCVFDFDNDGWPDIYVAADSTPSLLYRNNRDGTFTEVGLAAGAAFNLDGVSQAAMGVAAGDYDCDGYLDLFRTNFYDDTSTLFHNRRDGTFEDVTFASGIGINTRFLGWGVAFYDFDNDGWLDLLLVNGHVFPEIDGGKVNDNYEERKVVYRNLGNGKFEDVSLNTGPGTLLRRCSRGAAFGDLFNTGQIDVVINNMNDVPSLLRNVTPSPHNCFQVRLIGQKTNRAAIGSRAILWTGPHRQTAEVQSGGSFCSQNDLRLHFGLGTSGRVDRLEIGWLGGGHDVYRDLPVNCLVTLVEGTGVQSVNQIEGRHNLQAAVVPAAHSRLRDNDCRGA